MDKNYDVMGFEAIFIIEFTILESCFKIPSTQITTIHKIIQILKDFEIGPQTMKNIRN